MFLLLIIYMQYYYIKDSHALMNTSTHGPAFSLSPFIGFADPVRSFFVNIFLFSAFHDLFCNLPYMIIFVRVYINFIGAIAYEFIL